MNAYRGIQTPFVVHGQVSTREYPFDGHDANVDCCDFHDA